MNDGNDYGYIFEDSKWLDKDGNEYATDAEYLEVVEDE